MSKKSKNEQMAEQMPGPHEHQGPFEKSAPIKVSLGIYILSLLLVAVTVFVLMLTQYLSGYRSNYNLSRVVNNADVKITVSIPMAETETRKENPFTKEQRDRVAKLLEDMGAKSANVRIDPQ
ncbi:MAG: hypothetical protein CVT63_06560 [Candidatus Anoxymicrobium japonicum]|uniref:Uncharacterized protein n=1 Tax=Candidatus Anoxymicrobium japonicum TaxID=2013648 RepID=A0A2N3G545_9ACTN|nr:MAG: hypothetical protein CVT63_06560 [Candidatus Anoxymicrobium japonicum]